MSGGRLPIQIDPLRLARAGARLAGRLPLDNMSRLAAVLAAAPAEAEVELAFDMDAEGRACVQLKLRAEVQLQCQRCLGAMPYAVTTERLLACVGSDAEAERLPEPYEPLLFTGEPLFLRDVVEDELLLSLPIVPRHDDVHCAGSGMEEHGEDDTAEPRPQNPFAVLAGMKLD